MLATIRLIAPEAGREGRSQVTLQVTFCRKVGSQGHSHAK